MSVYGDGSLTLTAAGSGLYKVAHKASGLLFGIQDMGTGDGGAALSWGDNGTADQRGELRPPHAERSRACRSTARAGASGGCGAQALGSKVMPEGLAFSRW